MIKFTIAIPCYKNKFLKEALDSILIQTYYNYEIVILNDKSPYDIDSIVSNYHDKRIRYYKNEINCGAFNIINNWNKCLELSEGDYIIMMGDDDILLPECLSTYIELIKQYPNLNVYHGRTMVIDENSTFVRLHEARPEWENQLSLIWHRLNGRQQYIGDFLYNTKWLRDSGGYKFYPLAWGSDDMTAYLAAYKHGIANTNTPVFCYRVNRLSISMNSFIDVKLECNKLYSCDVNSIIKEYKENDNVDSLYIQMINKNLYRNEIKKDIHLFALDFISKGFVKTICSFIKLRKKYNLKWAYIVLSLIEYFKITSKK